MLFRRTQKHGQNINGILTLVTFVTLEVKTIFMKVQVKNLSPDNNTKNVRNAVRFEITVRQTQQLGRYGTTDADFTFRLSIARDVRKSVHVLYRYISTIIHINNCQK